MLGDEGHHAACVDAWLVRAGPGVTHLLDLFERSLDALWRRATATLGDVTVTAIADRVLSTTAELHPVLAAVKVGPHGFRIDELRLERDLRADHLREVLRVVLVALLTVLGSLTAEILTPALHAELSAVTLNDDDGSRSWAASTEARRTRPGARSPSPSGPTARRPRTASGRGGPPPGGRAAP